MTVSELATQTGQTLKSIVKICLQSRPTAFKSMQTTERRLIILGNGPSLRQTMADYGDRLPGCTLMAVNFAANTEEFLKLRPRYYVLADPHFMSATSEVNVSKLIDNINRTDWPMTVFVDRRFIKTARNVFRQSETLRIEGFNAVGAEGFGAFERFVYGRSIAMPRPRNVLIAAIMIGISLGFKEIFLTGADHSWMRTITVTDENNVISALDHYYKDNEKERIRTETAYRSIPLHDIVFSLYTAFRSYHRIEAFARCRGIDIYNSTPGSYIDAFRRKPLPL